MPLSVTRRSAIELDINIDITYRFSKPVPSDTIELFLPKSWRLGSVGNGKVSWYQFQI